MFPPGAATQHLLLLLAPGSWHRMHLARSTQWPLNFNCSMSQLVNCTICNAIIWHDASRKEDNLQLDWLFRCLHYKDFHHTLNQGSSPPQTIPHDNDFQWLVSVPLCMLVMERPRCDEWGEMTWWHGDTPINIQIQDAQIISKNVQIGWETDTGHQNSASILHNLGVIKFLRFYKPEQLLHWRWVGRSAGAISAVANTEVTTYFGWHTSFSLNR